MDTSATLRIARPTDNLESLSKMYMNGMGFKKLSSFSDPNGFDGVMLGHQRQAYHLEFTHCRNEIAGRAPSKDHLLVFYIPHKNDWQDQCEKMEQSGFIRVSSFNPFWDQSGATFEDIDGYRVVLENDRWEK